MRVTVIHWRVEDGEGRAEELRSRGIGAVTAKPQNGSMRALREDPPDAYVVDLSCRPSFGLEVACALRASRKTRHVPLVFAGGLPDKVCKAKEALPDAVFTAWEKIVPALTKAIRTAPANPVQPGDRISRSATPVAQKLGIAPGSTLTVIGAPEEYPECLSIPDDVTVHRRPGSASDRVLVFVDRASQLDSRFVAAETSVSPKGNIWVIWPKQSSGVLSDVNQNVVRQHGLARDWVDFKVCSLDKIWSGFLFGRKKRK